MAKPNGATIDAATVTPPIFGDRLDVFTNWEDYAVDASSFGIGEVSVVTQVKFSRPQAQDWVRCHPDPERIRYFDCVKDKKGNKLYVIYRALKPLVGSQARTFRVVQAVTTDGELYLWPAPIAGSMESDVTHFTAQQKALTSWVRIEWDGKAFQAFSPETDFGEPQWPDLPFSEVVSMALTGHLISGEEHPLIKRLLGRS